MIKITNITVQFFFRSFIFPVRIKCFLIYWWCVKMKHTCTEIKRFSLKRIRHRLKTRTKKKRKKSVWNKTYLSFKLFLFHSFSLRLGGNVLKTRKHFCFWWFYFSEILFYCSQTHLQKFVLFFATVLRFLNIIRCFDIKYLSHEITQVHRTLLQNIKRSISSLKTR